MLALPASPSSEKDRNDYQRALSAAAKVIAEDGHLLLSTEKLSQRSGVPQAQLVDWFDSPISIAEVLFINYLNDFSVRLKELMASVETRKQLEDSIELLMFFFAEQTSKDKTRLVLWKNLLDHASLRKLKDSASHIYTRIIVERGSEIYPELEYDAAYRRTRLIILLISHAVAESGVVESDTNQIVIEEYVQMARLVIADLLPKS